MSPRSRLAALAGRLAASLTAPTSTSSSAIRSSSAAAATAAAASSTASTSYAASAAHGLGAAAGARSFANPGIRVPVNRNQVSIRIMLKKREEGAKGGARGRGERSTIRLGCPLSPRSTYFQPRPPSPPAPLQTNSPPPPPRPPPPTTTTTRSTAPSATSTASARRTTSSPRGAPTGSSPGPPSGASSRPRPRRAGSPRGGSRRTCGGSWRGGSAGSSRRGKVLVVLRARESFEERGRDLGFPFCKITTSLLCFYFLLSLSLSFLAALPRSEARNNHLPTKRSIFFLKMRFFGLLGRLMTFFFLFAPSFFSISLLLLSLFHPTLRNNTSTLSLSLSLSSPFSFSNHTLSLSLSLSLSPEKK